MELGRKLAGMAAIVLVMAACSGETVTEQILESQEGVADVEIDENGGSVVIEYEDDDGDTAAVIGGGEIPADFPVPVPDGGNVMAVVTSGGDNSVSVTFPESEYETIKDFYESWAEGKEILTSFESTSPPGATWMVQEAGQTLNVSISASGSETALAIVVVSSG